MKKLILMIFLLFTPLMVYPDSNLYIYQNNHVIGVISISQFKNLIEGAERYKDIMEAQMNNRVTIVSGKVVKDYSGKYKTKFIVTWKNEKGETLNFISSTLEINIENDKALGIAKRRIIYRNVSEIGFPISFGLLLIIIALL